ncbi:uncharacterized protein TNCV_4431901 [Trichonephila clavipes]|nr:uncharacterized protein TNCV_4431901 [Trichonephila clavipes]
MGQTISEIVRQQGFSRCQVYINDGQKTSDRGNCKEQLALTVRGEKRLRRLVHTQRSQTLAQITSQSNDGVNSTVGKRNARFTLWVSTAVAVREYHCSQLAIGVLSGQESTETGNEKH